MTGLGSSAGALALLGLEWVRPLGFLTLLAPLLLLLFLRRPQPPRSEATGTLELWRRVEGEELSASTRTRRGLSWRAWLLCAALVLASLAIAGPRQERAPHTERWSVIVDRSPSMYLVRAPGESVTRYEVALEEAAAILDERASEGAEVRWVTPGEPSVSGAAPPVSWSEAPRVPRSEPRWERWDAPGNLWVTDRVERKPREGAGLAASGGAAIPGPIGSSGGRIIVWDGEELVEGGAAPPASIALDDALPEELRQLITIWAEERGFALGGDGEAVRLRVVVAGGEERKPVRAGGGGWELTGVTTLPGAPLEAEGVPLESWLEAEGASLVAFAPGRVVIALVEITSIGGDPASFAASWAELFDSSALPHPGTLSIEERRGAGRAIRVVPERPPETVAAGAGEVGLEAWLALAAVTLAVLAWFGRSGAEGRSSDPAGTGQ